MSTRLDRWLMRAYRTVGGGLFLALCAVVSYAAGDRHRSCRLGGADLSMPEAVPGLLRQTRIVDACVIRDARPLGIARPLRMTCTAGSTRPASPSAARAP